MISYNKRGKFWLVATGTLKKLRSSLPLTQVLAHIIKSTQMQKAILILLLSIPCLQLLAEEKEFWPYGSATYTNKVTWLAECDANSIDGKRYRIGEDIVACVTKTADNQPYGLVMSPSSGFSMA